MLKAYILYGSLVFAALIVSDLRGWVSFNLWSPTEKLNPGVQHK